MIGLDDLAAMAAIDSRRMLQQVGDFPRRIEAGFRQAAGLALPAELGGRQAIVVAGMGGSAICGDLAAGLLLDECPVPIMVLRDYGLPAWVGPQSLLIASSNSGNTEETLAVVQAAHERNVPLVVLAGGGRLAEMAAAWDVPLVRFDPTRPPRAALAFPLTLLLGILHTLGYAADTGRDLEDARAAMAEITAGCREEVPVADNEAKQMALRLHDRLPIVYGAGYLAAVARRWKGQFNENADTLAAYEELPEADHNTVVGTKLATGIISRATALLLTSQFEHPRTELRIEITAELLEKRRMRQEVIYGRGQTRLGNLLSLIHLGDYVSVYLALLNEIDPTEMTPIDVLKQRMAASTESGA